jgi:hypothetical protein
MSTTPTPEQIQKIQTNLRNMLELNDKLFNHGDAKISNAYDLLNIKDKADPGCAIALALFQGAFTAVGAAAGPAGGAAKFLFGMTARPAEPTSLNVNGQIASYLQRFQAMSLETSKQLATYHDDVTGHWNASVTVGGEVMRLSDLATVDVPAETSPKFFDLVIAAARGLDLQLWKQLLVANTVITHWTKGYTVKGSRNIPPIAWVEEFYERDRAYYFTWQWHKGSWLGKGVWYMDAYTIGPGAGESLSKDVCNYLFGYNYPGNSPGEIIKVPGLFTREEVFTKLGIREDWRARPDLMFENVHVNF